MSSRPVITIVGAGASAPRLCETLASCVAAPEVELRLSARHAGRLDILASHSRRRLAVRRPQWSVRAMPSLAAAVEEASIVVLLVRVGGLEARAWDEEFPRPFGLIGDEGLGPGGIANAWRTLPELASIARTIRQVAPEARLMNLMSPLGVTTRLLLDQELDAVGLCDLPLLTLESWLARTGRVTASVTWRYGGLNHLGWFWQFDSDGRDLLRFLADTPSGSAEAGAVDKATFEKYGAAPLRYFYDVFDPDAATRLRLTRSPNRARQLIELSQRLIHQFAHNPGLEITEADARPTPWLDRVVAPAIAAGLGGPAHQGFANLRNEGKIPELPAEVVVETAASFTATGVSAVPPGPLPPEVAQFLRRAAESERLAYLAAVRRDSKLLEQAIRALPLSIPESAVTELAALAQRTVPSPDQEHR